MAWLAKQGYLVPESQVQLVRTGVGVGSRERIPKADVSTPEALKRTLLGAKSLAFTAEGKADRPSRRRSKNWPSPTCFFDSSPDRR